MSDQEGHLDPVHVAVQVHVLGLGEEIVHVARAEHPEHVLPVMRHGVLAFALHALVLYFVPVVVGTPGSAAGKARFVSHRTRRKVTAQRNAGHADRVVLHAVLRFQPVHPLRRPPFGIRRGGQIVQAQRIAGSRLVDAQGVDAALGQGIGQPAHPKHLLHAVEPVAIDHAGSRTIHRRAMEQAGDFLAFIRDRHMGDRIARQLHPAQEIADRLLVGFQPAG